MKQFLALYFLLQTLLLGSPLRFGELGDFLLENGDTIKDCRIGYTIYGEIAADSSNIILFPTWFAGHSSHIKGALGRGKLADTTRFAVIALDALGNGISSSPSNSKSQPDTLFPKFTICDMVNSQYALLTQALNIKSVFAVMGGSMGGMQTFQWIVSYPDFMKYAVPYVGTPRPGSSDRLFWKAQTELIETGWKYKIHPDELLKLFKLYQNAYSTSPNNITATVAYEDFEEYINPFFGEHSKYESVCDRYYQITAMLGHNIAAPFENNITKAAAQVQAKTLIIVAKQDHLVNPQPALDFAKIIKAKTLIVDNPKGHLGIAPEFARISKVIHKFWK
ncbi:MAG TPA: alpha/beta fold hydrolase [Candidatus Marinimicrobia bacterium]|nr:alpha/beta fold hydrolase [Candidatus Neomarinimicrobiota bacterium]